VEAIEALWVLWAISGSCRVALGYVGVSSGHITHLWWRKVWVEHGFLCGKRGQIEVICERQIFGNQVTAGLPNDLNQTVRLAARLALAIL
jgi:hypothetical protein